MYKYTYMYVRKYNNFKYESKIESSEVIYPLPQVAISNYFNFKHILSCIH